MTTRKASNGQSEEASDQGDSQTGSTPGAQDGHEDSEKGAVTFVYSDFVGRIINVPGEGSRIFQPGDTIDTNIDPRYFKEATK